MQDIINVIIRKDLFKIFLIAIGIYSIIAYHISLNSNRHLSWKMQEAMRKVWFLIGLGAVFIVIALAYGTAYNPVTIKVVKFFVTGN